MTVAISLSKDASSSSSSQNSASLSSPTHSASRYTIRPFEEADLPSLESICRTVYGGRDYLPHIALSLVQDPCSHFTVLQDEDPQQQQQHCDTPKSASSSIHPSTAPSILAVANARSLQLDRILWLEAVRTAPTHRNQGHAQRLAQHWANMAQQNQQRLLSCTVESNAAMIRVFTRVGMKRISMIHQLDFSQLLLLDGWAARTDRQHAAQPLLLALALPDGAVSEAVQRRVWEPVTTWEQLQSVLQRVRCAGGMGYLPGLYELLSQQQVDACLESGLVWKTDCGQAAVALVRDEKIQSLASPWVCSIAATRPQDAEAALCFACTGEKARPFTVALDGAVDIRESSLLQALPFVSDRCVLYGTSEP